ncbi:MAG: dihydrolipoyl dehydrogenase [Pseudomonadota bacterium]
MSDISCKLLIVGAGPGGYVAGIRAGQLGVDTVVVDAKALGGTCLNVGCIPSKALIHAADEFEKANHFAHQNALGISNSAPEIDLRKTVAWKDGVVSQLTGGVGALLKKAKVTVVPGWAKFIDGKTVRVEGEDGTTTIHAETICIATGSASTELPNLPFGGDILSSTEALSMPEVPKSLAVVGAGYIGLELGMAYAKFGSKVTVVELQDRILPLYDKELTKPVANRLKDLGIDVKLGFKAASHADGQLKITNVNGDTEEVDAAKVLVTVGRRPATEGLGLENLVLDMDGPFIKVDERCQTTMAGVYAIGDVTGEPMLAHRAMAQGEMIAEIIAGEGRVWDKVVIPAICFTDPEIISAGLSPDDAKNAGIDVVTASFPFAANGRSLSMERSDGFVRVVARKDNHLILGLQAVGKGCAELASTFGIAMEMGARLEDVGGTIHAHPSQGEALQEAALRSLGSALHI